MPTEHKMQSEKREEVIQNSCFLDEWKENEDFGLPVQAHFVQWKAVQASLTSTVIIYKAIYFIGNDKFHGSPFIVLVRH